MRAFPCLLGSIALALWGASSALASDAFEVDLAPCSETLCGAASDAALDSGSVEVDDDGEVEVEIEAGAPGTALCVVYEPIGGEPVEIGTVTTDPEGNVEAEAGALAAEQTMGLFVLHADDCASGAPLYVNAFTTHPGDDDEDYDPDDPNEFDDVDEEDELKDGYKAAKRSLRTDYKDEKRELRDDYREDRDELKADYEDRRGDF